MCVRATLEFTSRPRRSTPRSGTSSPALTHPNWRVEKDRLESEKAKNAETWQRGSGLAFDKLKDIASRRTDIFGSIEKETEIGHKIGEGKPIQKMTWDGVTQR